MFIIIKQIGVNMNNITKIGLTALAGSLVATSAFAGAMSVSGSAKVTYGSNGEERSTGAPYSNSKGITFSGSGELDNGFTVSTGYTMSNAAFSSSYVSFCSFSSLLILTRNPVSYK